MIRVPTRTDLLRQLPCYSVGAEIGVAHGAFAAEILEHVQPETLYLVDDWSESCRWVMPNDPCVPVTDCGDDYHIVMVEADQARRDVYRRFMGQIISGQVRILWGRSQSVLPAMPDGCLDWAYIDADHSYEGCKADLDQCYRLVRPGGWLMGHDFCQEFSGVMKAVQEFVQAHELRIDYLTAEKPCPVLDYGRRCAFNSYAIRRL